MTFISSNFVLSTQDITSFKQQGFLKLKSFFSEKTIEHMANICSSAVIAPKGNYGSGFSKLKYDIGNDDNYILSMMKDER